MPQDEKSTPQVRKVYELLVKPIPVTINLLREMGGVCSQDLYRSDSTIPLNKHFETDCFTSSLVPFPQKFALF